MAERMIDPYNIAADDIVLGMRHFLRGKRSIHGDAFEAFLARVAFGVLRIESMMEDYLDAMAEVGE